VVPRIRKTAVVSALDVFRLALVVFTSLEWFVSVHGKINPLSRVPVRVVVTFLRALITTTITVVVLAGEASCLPVQVTVSSEQALVAESVLAIHVVIVVLVHTETNIVVAVVVLALGWGFRDGTSGHTVTETIITHVLDNNFTFVLRVTTSVLVGPLKRELFTDVIIQGSYVGTTTVIVLRIEQTVGIVPVTTSFVETVVGATRVVEIHVSHDGGH
jgi:hypothetical protein